jgi:hypothetical protein
VIEGPDFVWLHLPHCGGAATDAVLRSRWGADTRFLFDCVSPANPACHDTVADRQRRDPGFALAGRKIVCNIARLPTWTAARRRWSVSVGQLSPSALDHLPTPDAVLRRYTTPAVEAWLRVEHQARDLDAVFGADTTPDDARPRAPEADPPFTTGEIEALYAANPRWSELEHRLYGSLALPAAYQKVA